MALFRFSDVASNVGLEDLTALVRETATTLLDPRFSAESDLDDATCAQMAKAINKTAVNAATGAPRHTSFKALIAIQQQLAIEASSSLLEYAKEFNGRLSRVISRLFVRVIKAEEAAGAPYSPDSIDMESIVCTMEDTLESFKRNGGTANDACHDMVSNFAESVLKIQGDFVQLRKIMEDAGISVANSSLAAVLAPLVPEEVATGLSVEFVDTAKENSETVKVPSVADLVTSLGNSKEGTERDAALAELRRHKDEFGADELDAYLDEVSPAFRRFIEDQLAAGVSSPSNSEASSAMSERLRKLRTRLQATERAVKSAVEETDKDAPQSQMVARASKPNTLSLVSMSGSASSRSSRLTQPSPRASHFTHASPSKRASSQSGLALPSPSKITRASAAERLESPSKAADGPRERHVARSTRSERTTAAANLRARLEAVKLVKK